MTRPRRIALWVGGGLGATFAGGAAGLAGVLRAETRLARRRIPTATEPPPPTDGTTWTAPGVEDRGSPIELVVLGDSTAGGYGVHHARETPPALLATGISGASGRPVHVTTLAVVGAESRELADQVARLDAARPDLAVIMIGANDVTARIPPSVAVPYLAAAVRALQERGTQVIVCTCPDLGTIRPLAQPLRAFARRLSRQLARAQTVAVVEAGGRTVSLGDLLGPLFSTNREMFSDDQFHPSAAGYAEAARGVLPSALDALGIETRTRSASAFTTQRRKPLAKSAAQAVVRPGTEVAAAGGSDPRGRLARLRRRIPSGPRLRRGTVR